MPRKKLARPNFRLRLRGRVWAIDFTDEITGHSRRVSTGETERARAEIWRDQWIAGREQPLPPPQPTIAAILDAYVTARLPHVQSKAVLRVTAVTVSKLIGNLQPHMLHRLAYGSRRALDAVADGTLRREIGVLRAALAWAMRERWIAEAPYVSMPPRPAPRDRWLTRDEIDALIQAAEAPHIRLYIALGYHTAARHGAILDLTWDRVDLERRLISYDRPGRAQNNKRRATVPINAVALAELQAHRMVGVTDHVIEWRGRPVLSIKNGFAAAAWRAGIADCSPHILRHSAATHLVMARVPMVDIARMLGDSVAMIEKVYGKHSPDFLRSAADALAGGVGPRGGEKWRITKRS